MGQLLYEELPLFFCTILCPLQILPHLKPNWGYQYFICNAENKRFLSSNGNTPANIGCMCGQNRLFVEFIHIYRRGMIYHVPYYVRENNISPMLEK